MESLITYPCMTADGYVTIAMGVVNEVCESFLMSLDWAWHSALA